MASRNMGPGTTKDLLNIDPAIGTFLRLAAQWKTAHAAGLKTPAVDADSEFLAGFVQDLRLHIAKPVVVAGRGVVKLTSRDFELAGVAHGRQHLLEKVVSGECSEPNALDILSSELKREGIAKTPEEILARLSISGGGLAEWIRRKRGPVGAARAFVALFFGRSARTLAYAAAEAKESPETLAARARREEVSQRDVLGQTLGWLGYSGEARALVERYLPADVRPVILDLSDIDDIEHDFDDTDDLDGLDDGVVA